MRTRPRDYDELERMLLDGSVKPVIDRTYSLDDGVNAYAALERGGVRGKIAIRVRAAS